jgi:uncharacterized protein YbaR (Trm112 family)
LPISDCRISLYLALEKLEIDAQQLLTVSKGVKSVLMIPQDLLDILVCPICKKPLELRDNGQSLKCAQCRRVYPVRDNIPILLVDEATVDPA